MAIKPRAYEVKALRKRHGITQQDLADAMYEVSLFTVRSWETGNRQCHPQTWWAIVLIFDQIDLRVDEELWIKKFRSRNGSS